MRISLEKSYLPVFITFFVAFLIFGYIVSGQFMITSSRSALRNLSNDELRELYNGVSSELVNMRMEVLSLKTRLNDLKSKSENQKEVVRSINEEIELLEAFLGLKPVHGPGVKVIISFEGNVINETDLFDVLNELKASGAEAVAVNKIRATHNSYFSFRQGRYQFDGHNLSKPVVFEAIGDPDTLEGALNIAGGVKSTLEGVEGVTVVIEKRKNIVIPARESLRYDYATPAE